MWDWIKNLFAPSTTPQSPTLPSGSLSVQNSPILGGAGLGSGSLSTSQSTPQTLIKPSVSSPSLPSGQLSTKPYSSILYGVGGQGGSVGGIANSTANSLVAPAPVIRPLIGPLMTGGNFYSGGTNTPIGPKMSDGSFYSGTSGSPSGTYPASGTASTTPISGTYQAQGTASTTPIAPTVSNPTMSQSSGSSSAFNPGSFGSPSTTFNPTTSFGGMFSNSLLGGLSVPSTDKLSDEEKMAQEINRRKLLAQAAEVIPTTGNKKLPSTTVPETLTPRTALPKSTTSVSKEGTLADLNTQAQSKVAESKRENPSPDQPMINDQAQEDALNSVPREQRSSLQQEIDTLKAGLGYSDALKQKQELGLKLQAVNDIFGKAIKDIEDNSELPKGLAARRIGELNKEWNLTANQYTGSIGILNQTLEAIDNAVNERLKIKEMSQVNTPEQPGSVQEYQYAVNQGYGGSYTDFKSMNSSGVTINMGEQIAGKVETQNALQNAADKQTIDSAYRTISNITKKYGAANPKRLTLEQAAEMTDADAVAIGKATSIIQNPLSSKVNPNDVQDSLQPSTLFGSGLKWLAQQNPWNDDYDKNFSPSKLIEAVQSSSVIAEGKGSSANNDPMGIRD